MSSRAFRMPMVLSLLCLLLERASAASFVGSSSNFKGGGGGGLLSQRDAPLTHQLKLLQLSPSRTNPLGGRNMLLQNRLHPSIVTTAASTNTRSTTICHLFFGARQDKKRKKAQARIPAWALDELSRKDAPLPFQFPLSQEGSNGGGGDDDNSSSYSIATNKNSNKLVTVRLLKVKDLEQIVPMCVSEFGAGESTLEDFLDSFPWNKKPEDAKEYVVDWWENFVLPSLIYWTFRSKIVAQRPQDHALLVVTIHQQNDNNINNNIQDDAIVGMVEMSQQPPQPSRNPPAYPLPMWYKEVYCKQNNLPPPDGWVTNLLVGPNFRGQGYSKLLMAAAEGMARTWDCSMVQLHCDASVEGGKVPQKLYTALGYEMVEDPNSPFAWMGSDFSTKIWMIQDVALLYFRKAL